jgi:hypothetical protein
MNVALSDDSIRGFIPNIIKYDELEGVSPERLLRNLPVVILYETGPNYGHWTLLHKLGNGNIEFFDSYGFKPDKEFELMGREYQLPHMLMELLTKLSKLTQIHYNQYQFQSKTPGVATCGRWVILRHMFNDVDIDRFKKAIEDSIRKLGISPDQFVVGAVP